MDTTQQGVQGVYSRMYRAMSDHKEGLISFSDMLQVWKDEAKMIRERYEKDIEETTKVPRYKAA